MLLVAVEVDVSHDWVDYATLAATAFAALGTVGAVIWAIFGASWKQRRRRPILKLVNRYEGSDAFYEKCEPRVVDGVCLRLENLPGRETAKGVEVLLTVFSFLPEAGIAEIPLVTDENLNFNGNDGSTGRSRASVPGGVARRVYLARLGDPQELYCGAWATTPAHQDVIAWLQDGSEYRIELTVAGHNIDVTRYGARVEVSRSDLRGVQIMGMQHPINISFSWIEDLAPLTAD